MAAMSTTLTEFASLGDSRTYTVSGHSVTSPKLVIQKRKVPTGNQVVQENTISVIYGTVDSGGEILPQKVLFSGVIRYPVSSTSTAITAALAVFRDIVASDEFGATVTTQNFVE